MIIGVTGGSKEIANIFVEKYSALDFSRTTGYDISKENDRHKIIMKSLECDLFINHAYSGDSSQLELLYELSKAWIKFDKTGYIINTGSIITHFEKYDNLSLYGSYKKSTDDYCKILFKKFQSGLINFKTTNLKLGMLDTRNSRNKKHWSGRGITSDEFHDIVMWLYNTPSDQIVGEIVMETRLVQS